MVEMEGEGMSGEWGGRQLGGLEDGEATSNSNQGQEEAQSTEAARCLERVASGCRSTISLAAAPRGERWELSLHPWPSSRASTSRLYHLPLLDHSISSCCTADPYVLLMKNLQINMSFKRYILTIKINSGYKFNNVLFRA